MWHVRAGEKAAVLDPHGKFAMSVACRYLAMRTIAIACIAVMRYLVMRTIVIAFYHSGEVLMWRTSRCSPDGKLVATGCAAATVATGREVIFLQVALFHWAFHWLSI